VYPGTLTYPETVPTIELVRAGVAAVIRQGLPGMPD
jgi:hypothetical protein